MTLLRARRLAAHLTNDTAAKLAVIRDSQSILSVVADRALQPGGGAPLMDQVISARRNLVEDALGVSDAALAVELIEASKALGLRRDANRAQHLPDGLSEAEATEYRSCADRLRAVNIFLSTHAELPKGVRRTDMASEAAAIAAKLRSFEARDQAFSAHMLDWRSIRAIARQADAALVYLFAAVDGAGAAIVIHGASPDGGRAPDDVIPLEALNEHVLFTRLQRGLDLTLDRMTALMDTAVQAAAAELGWAGAYKAYRMTDLPATARRTAFSVWLRKINETSASAQFYLHGAYCDAS